MNLLFRLIWLFITSKWNEKKDLLDQTSYKGRVLINDLDLNMHVNNGRFLSIADLGRIKHLQQTGFLRIMLEKKWKPIMASVNTRFFRPLKLGQTYELKTKFLCWDDKFGYFEHRFESKGKLVAIVYVKGLFVGPKGRVDIQEAADALGISSSSPIAPDVIDDLREQREVA